MWIKYRQYAEEPWGYENITFMHEYDSMIYNGWQCEIVDKPPKEWVQQAILKVQNEAIESSLQYIRRIYELQDLLNN